MNVFSPQVLLAVTVPLAVTASAVVVWLRRRNKSKAAAPPPVLGMRQDPNGNIEWLKGPPGPKQPIFLGDLADLMNYSRLPGGSDLPEDRQPSHYVPHAATPSPSPVVETAVSPLVADAIERLERKDLKGARSVLQVALVRAMNRGDRHNQARARELFARLECQEGNYAAAVAQQTLLMSLVPAAGKEPRDLDVDYRRYLRLRDDAQEVGRLHGAAKQCCHDDPDEALALTEQAVSFAERQLSPDHFLVAEVLVTRGSILYERGETVDAREAWQQAEEILGKQPERAPQVLLAVRLNLRRCRRRLGF